MESYVVNLRRQLHMHPEIGFDLDETLAILRAELDALGVEYTEQYGKSSIVATVNPEKRGFTIGVRADMDALPIEEKNDVPYKSQNPGVMHACGHDAHTAIAMAALRRVWEMRDQLACCVKFLFQPAEEYNTSGAMLMAEDGVMEGIDCIVALHCDTNFEAGEIAILPGPMNAISDGFYLDFYGKAAHAARQQKGVDAIMMAMRAFMDIELVVAKGFSAKEPIVFNVGAINGGKTNNIVPDHCRMFCTLRTWSDEVAEGMLTRIKAIIEAVALTAGGRATLTPVKHYPLVVSDPAVTEAVRRIAVDFLGEDKVKVASRGMGGEDFSYFTALKPGSMFRLGVKTPGAKSWIGVHNECFNIDESALEVGVEMFVRFILQHQNGLA